jgi:prepilin-type N-terminal cleavage/methylation domain-containing protein
MRTSRGFTLIELMIALAIMLVVSMVTVQLSVSVFATNTQLIHMTQLTSEMRSTMQIISRDVRRAGYNSDALASFLTTQTISSGVVMGDPDESGATDCLQVIYDDISEGKSDETANVVYRLRTISGVGRVSVLYGDNATVISCDTLVTDAGWVDMSDPLLVNIASLQFIHFDSQTDIAENLSNGHVIEVGVERVSITIDATLRDNATISRSIINEVQIRNQTLRV